MGSFNVTCSLTKQTISAKDEVIMVLLTRHQSRSNLLCYNWDAYSPVPVFIEGFYNDGGGLDKAQLFYHPDVKSKVSKNTLKQVNQEFFKSLSKKAQQNKENPETAKSLSELLSFRELSFVNISSKLEVFKLFYQMYEELNVKYTGKELQSMTVQLDKSLSSFSALASFEELKNEIKHLETQPQKKTFRQIELMMMKKEALMYMLDNYYKDVKDNKENISLYDDKYGAKLQLYRASNPTMEKHADILDYNEGSKNYAGQNSPQFTFRETFNSLKEKEKTVNIDEVDTLYVQQALDFSLLCDYMNVLGKTWQPSMIVSECIQDYGHKEAYMLQQELLNQVGYQPTPPVAKKKLIK